MDGLRELRTVRHLGAESPQGIPVEVKSLQFWAALIYFTCIRVASATEGAVFEVIAAPQEQPAQAQEERCENTAQGPSDPSSVQQPEGKPRCTSF